MKLNILSLEVKCAGRFSALRDSLKEFYDQGVMEFLPLPAGRGLRVERELALSIFPLIVKASENTTLSIDGLAGIDYVELYSEDFGSPLECLISDKLDALGGVLDSLTQSPMDYSSDSFYDYFFPIPYITKRYDESEEIVVQAKLHLCIQVNEQTGKISYSTNRILADSDHELIEDFTDRETLIHSGKPKSPLVSTDFAGAWDQVIREANLLLDKLEGLTGIDFEDRPTRKSIKLSLVDVDSKINVLFANIKPVS